MMRRLGLRFWMGLGCCGLALLAALAPGAVAHASTPAVSPDQILSNERTFTRWAYTYRIANIYRQPNTSSGRITRLTWYTADGFSSIYLLLRAHWDAQGREWIKLRIPMRPNGMVGWVERDALGAFHLTHLAVVVDRRALRIHFYDDGRLVWSAPVGVGSPGMPTPPGRYWVNEVFDISNPYSGYYPYAFGTSDYSTLTEWPGGGVVGIHGPYFAPADAIPGRISHGCVRLRIPDDRWLGHHLTYGVPVQIL